MKLRIVLGSIMTQDSKLSLTLVTFSEPKKAINAGAKGTFQVAISFLFPSCQTYSAKRRVHILCKQLE
jgi:hypothetical protein